MFLTTTACIVITKTVEPTPAAAHAALAAAHTAIAAVPAAQETVSPSHNLPAEQTSNSKYLTPQHKRRRSPSPSTVQTPSIHTLPTKWAPSSQYYDVNPVRGLTLPRLVSSTFHSRQLGIADMDPLTVPIANIVPFGVENWMIRYMSHGRYIQWEAFRTKREAVVMSHIENWPGRTLRLTSTQSSHTWHPPSR